MCSNICSECGERKAVSRGLCNRCYLRAWKRRAHWLHDKKRRGQDLEAVGLCECGGVGVEKVILCVGVKPVVYLLCDSCLAIERRYGRIRLAVEVM